MSPILVLMIGIWLADTLRESKAKEEKLKKKEGLDQSQKDSIKIEASRDVEEKIELKEDKFWDEGYRDDFWDGREEGLDDLESEDLIGKKVSKPKSNKSLTEDRIRELFNDMEKGLNNLLEDKKSDKVQDNIKDVRENIQSDIELQDSINRQKRELEEREVRIRQKERDLEEGLRKRLEEEKASLSLASDRKDIINAIILSEVLDKPKSLR